MGPKVVVTVRTEFELIPPGVGWVQHASNTARKNIKKLVDYLNLNYPNLSYKASSILTSVVIDIYEYNDDQSNLFLMELRNLEYVDGAERIDNCD
jgi:hypothetical protein